MIDLPNLWEQAPLSDDNERRLPRGPVAPRRRPTAYAAGGALMGLTGLMLLGAFLGSTSGAAMSAPMGHASPAFVTSAHCSGTLTVHAPATVQVGQKITITVTYSSTAASASRVCGAGSIYHYIGLPAGMMPSQTAKDTGIAQHVGTYHALVIVTGPAGTLSRGFTMVVTAG